MLRINLQPKVVLEAKEGLQLPLWPTALIAIMVVLGVGTIYMNTNTRIISSKAEIKRLDFDLRDFQKILSDYEEANQEQKYLKGKRDFVLGISESQRMWVDFFNKLAGTMPQDVWITRFDGKRIGGFTMEGNTFTYSAIGHYMLQLYSIEYIKVVNLESATGQAPKANANDKGASAETAASSLSKKFRMSGDMDLTPKAEKEKKAQQQAPGPGQLPRGSQPPGTKL